MAHATGPEIVIDPQGNEHLAVDFNDDYEAGIFGYWLFIFTEFMMFGAMFMVFTIYFTMYTADFVEMSKEHMNLMLGGTNTVVLLISAYMMGLGMMNLEKGNHDKAIKFIWYTIALSVVFLSIKAIEWSHDIHLGLFPGDPVLESMSKGANLYFGMYFSMTGLHGLHIIIGIAFMYWTIKSIKNGEVGAHRPIFMKNVTLYWDFVHLIWVFLFPLYYMIGGAA